MASRLRKGAGPPLPGSHAMVAVGASVPSSEPVPVIDHTVITRCRVCRTYINPFSTFLSHGRRWRCNMCFRVHDLPADYDYDPAKRTHVRSDAILVYPILAAIPPPH